MPYRGYAIPMRRWLLGAVSLWPPVYFAFFALVVAIATVRGGGDPDEHLLVDEQVLSRLHVVTLGVILALLALFVRDAYRNPRLRDERRTFWAMVLLLAAPIAMPIYWWTYMRPRERPEGDGPDR